jgi:hypothetical protein
LVPPIQSKGGVDHLNEQPCSYWAKLFRSNGFDVFDIFRPELWGSDDIEFWYQQNTYLYVQKDSNLYKSLVQMKVMPLSNLNFMDCIHPRLYKIHSDYSIQSIVRPFAIKYAPKFLWPSLRRLKDRFLTKK